MTDRADDADWGTAKEITVTGFLASDRADEIQACTRIFEESFRHGADSEYALDALRAYGDERAGQWVSVEERLPGSASWVLVCADGALNCLWFFNGSWREPTPDNIVVSDITHWQPLPEPPEKP